jgi:hypothetical protein
MAAFAVVLSLVAWLCAPLGHAVVSLGPGHERFGQPVISPAELGLADEAGWRLVFEYSVKPQERFPVSDLIKHRVWYFVAKTIVDYEVSGWKDQTVGVFWDRNVANCWLRVEHNEVFGHGNWNGWRFAVVGERDLNAGSLGQNRERCSLATVVRVNDCSALTIEPTLDLGKYVWTINRRVRQFGDAGLLASGVGLNFGLRVRAESEPRREADNYDARKGRPELQLGPPRLLLCRFSRPNLLAVIVPVVWFGLAFGLLARGGYISAQRQQLGVAMGAAGMILIMLFPLLIYLDARYCY